MTKKDYVIKQGQVVPAFDPFAQPFFIANEGLSAITPDVLNSQLLLKAFEPNFMWQADPLIQDWNEDKLLFNGQQAYIEAATLMPLIHTPYGIHMVLTRRAKHLKKHSGQISFPGGRIDASDISAANAALRETHEEIGVEPYYVQLLGQMPDLFTGTGFLMRSYVAELRPGYTFRANADEVEEVFTVPLAFLMDPAHHRLHTAALPDGKVRSYFSMPWNDYYIWGATAAVIRNFYFRLQQALRA